jgi:prepilin-type N-terminal cleavage/methylation domain-containing protein
LFKPFRRYGDLEIVITHRLKQYLRTTRTSDGLTLIECLVAIIMVGLVSSAIAPALVISVATRVQSQKAEQALELAQTEIDKVRLLMERDGAAYDNGTVSTLPPSAQFTGTYNADKFVASVAGATYGAPVASPTTAFQTREQVLNGHQFAVQVYRTPGKFIGSVPVSFNLGVRVYDYSAVVAASSGNLATDPASLGVIGTTGKRNSRPLAALYTSMTASGSTSLCRYIQYLDTAAAVPTGCN